MKLRSIVGGLPLICSGLHPSPNRPSTNIHCQAVNVLPTGSGSRSFAPRSRATQTILPALFVVTLLGPHAQAVTVTESTRAVQSKNLIVRWSTADPEAIVSVQWNEAGAPAGQPNLTASANVGSCPAPLAPEYGATAGPAVLRSPASPSWSASATRRRERGPVAFGHFGAAIESESSECFPPFVAAEVPVTTRYRFGDNKPGAAMKLPAGCSVGD